MHPLRFPNSGIRDNVFVRKIGFKLRVMRLNRVESFYAFLLHFCSEGSKEEGRLATASPHVGPARPRPRPPTRGWATAARAIPQGATDRKGQSSPTQGQRRRWRRGGKERARASF
ncbi:hypothetical protein GW17_00062161 [Ensete ventricosum]|nr:hypothetical protein GW17_00062161 [Ensete ventricosum]